LNARLEEKGLHTTTHHNTTGIMMTHQPLVFLSACVIFLSSAPLASAYLLSYYDGRNAASVAYSTVPANFGRPFPRDSADGLALNIFLPPVDVFWDLCDITNITSGAVSTTTDTGSSPDVDNGTNVTDATDTGTSTGATNNIDNSTEPVRSLRGNDDSFSFDRERYGIHRKSIALIIIRGDCTFQQKATNAIALNQHFLNSSTLSRKRSRELELKRGLLLDPEPQPQIDFLIVMNNKFAPNPDSPFNMGKFNESDPYIDISMLSIGFSSGDHLLMDMWKESLKYDDADKSVRYLDSTAFLPLDSAERTGDEWLFPVSVDGLPPRRGSTRARFLLVFVFVTLMFPVVRMLMYCCVHYHDLQWRRNERGWIVGFNWTRRNHEGNEGVWNLAGFQMGVVRGRPVTHTLTKEQVCALPTIQFGVDDLKDVIRKYRGDVVENDECTTGAEDEDEEGTSTSTNLEVKPPAAAEVSTVDENNASTDILSNEGDARVHTEDTANDAEGATNDKKDAPVEKKDNAFVQAAFDSCVSCSICICEFEHGEEIRLLPECGHAFHTECILPWLTEKKNLCPLCQQKVNEGGREHQERLSFPLSSLNGEHFLNEANPGGVERNDAQSPLAANRSGDEEEGTIRNLSE
jgi:hypothetical protein